MKNKQEPEDQKQLINEADWDVLIYLDSCRWDYFQTFATHYPNLSKGSMKPVRSAGGWFGEHILNTYSDQEKYPWNFYSAHPEFEENGKHYRRRNSISGYFNLKQTFQHFEKIQGCLSGLPTLPEEVVQHMKHQLPLNQKSIIWFAQPHKPYVGSYLEGTRSFTEGGIREELYGSSENTVGRVRKGYKFNLLYVLYNVARLAGKLDGKVVITSENGRLLYDKGKGKQHFDNKAFAYLDDEEYELVSTVPWLEVNASECTDLDSMDDGTFISKAFNAAFDRLPDDEARTEYLSHLDEKQDFDRQWLIETLLHSEEFCKNNGNPDELLGVNHDED